MSECEKYEIHKIRDQQICVVKLGSKFKIVIVEIEDKANFYVIRKGSFSSFEKKIILATKLFHIFCTKYFAIIVNFFKTKNIIYISYITTTLVVSNKQRASPVLEGVKLLLL